MASKQQADQEFDPKYEWQENAANFLLRVHLSGFRKEDFRVQVDGTGRLTVRGQRADGGKHVRFHKVFQLPPTSNLDDISGRFDAGVLNITVPKRPAPPKEEKVQGKVDDEAKKVEQTIKKPAEEKKAEQSIKKPAEEKKPKAELETTKKPEEDKQEMEAKKTEEMEAAKSRRKPAEEHKTMTPPAVRKEEEGKPKVQEGRTTTAQQQAADRDSLLERVRAQAKAAAEEAERQKKQTEEAERQKKQTEEAERQKKQSACGGWNWKEELQGIKASEWAEGALDTVKKNKEVIAAAVAAFSLGLFVSSRIFSRK